MVAFEKADCVICVGYDMVEYHPDMWNPERRQDDHPYRCAARRSRCLLQGATGLLGDIGESLRGIALRTKPRGDNLSRRFARRSSTTARNTVTTRAFPVKPQKILWDLRAAGTLGHRHLGRRRAQDVDFAHVQGGGAEHLHHFEQLCIDGNRCRVRSRPSSRTRIEKSSPSPATRDS